MDQLEAIENNVAADTETASSVYVPSLQLTEGQPPPIAANGGLSYMSFDRDGDAGTAAAIEAAFKQITEGQAVVDMIDNAPPGPIETKWGLGFREYEECLDYIRANNIEAPEGGQRQPHIHWLQFFERCYESPQRIGCCIGPLSDIGRYFHQNVVAR